MPMKTIRKTAQTIQPGDVFRCEYGDDGNWCNFVFVSCKPSDYKGTEIIVHYEDETKNFEIYDTDPIDKVTFDVIEKEE